MLEGWQCPRGYHKSYQCQKMVTKNNYILPAFSLIISSWFLFHQSYYPTEILSTANKFQSYIFLSKGGSSNVSPVMSTTSLFVCLASIVVKLRRSQCSSNVDVFASLLLFFSVKPINQAYLKIIIQQFTYIFGNL